MITVKPLHHSAINNCSYSGDYIFSAITSINHRSITRSSRANLQRQGY